MTENWNTNPTLAAIELELRASGMPKQFQNKIMESLRLKERVENTVKNLYDTKWISEHLSSKGVDFVVQYRVNLEDLLQTKVTEGISKEKS